MQCRGEGTCFYTHSDLNDASSLVHAIILKENYRKMLPINYQRYALCLNTVYIFTLLFYN